MTSRVICEGMCMTSDGINSEYILKRDDFTDLDIGQVYAFPENIKLFPKSICSTNTEHACIFGGIVFKNNKREGEYTVELKGNMLDKELNTIGEGTITVICNNSSCSGFGITFRLNK